MEMLRDLADSAMMLPAFGMLFVLLERFLPERRRSLFRRASLVDVGFYMLGPIVVPAALTLLDRIPHLFASGVLTEGWGPAKHLPFWAALVGVALVHDFTGYWVHRWMHSAALWPIHAAHHSSAQVNWLSLFRLHPLDSIFLHFLRTLPLLVIGFAPAAVAAYGVFFGLWGMVVHANVRLPMGPLRYVFVSPRHHHRHHALLDEGDRGRNYAAVFSFWDRLFGTLDPVDAFPDAYGLRPQPRESFVGLLLSPITLWIESWRLRARRRVGEC